MNEELKFLYWLDGFLTGKENLSKEEIETIRKSLDHYLKESLKSEVTYR